MLAMYTTSIFGVWDNDDFRLWCKSKVKLMLHKSVNNVNKVNYPGMLRLKLLLR